MFVVILSYQKPLSDVDAFLSEHVQFLQAQYDAGVFIASGPRVPRVGGVILATARTRGELEQILAQDPFQREAIASYEVLEFTPNRMRAGFEAFAS